MRRGGHRVAFAMLVTVGLCCPAARAATFIVSSTADSGVGSLRQAILDANAATDADTIAFAISDPGAPRISPSTDLPAITNPVVIDATTQSPAGRVELSGTTAIGLTLSGLTITVRGFVINGFTSAGIQIAAGGDDVVEGNFIGTNVAGTASASPTSATGIAIIAVGGIRIGGWDAAARNLISGNGIGVAISWSAPAANLIVGNWIGTDGTGLAALPNADAGITSFLTSSTVVGGTAAGADNVIAGNGSDGIAISGSSWVVQGNAIGIGADGVTAIPNGRHGVRLFNGATNTLVGGAGPNHIAYNKHAGVLLAINASTGNAILGNAIHDNGALGIDLNNTGVAVNDAGDVDGGPNLGQNYPVLDAGFAGGDTVDGGLDSTPLTSFTIELFANLACDASGHGEARELVGTLAVATDALGQATFTASLARTIGPTEFVTATATDPNGNTSELSACAPMMGPTTTSSTTSSSTSSSSVPAPSSSSSTAVAPSTTTSTVAPPSTTTTLDPAPTTSTTTPDDPGTTSTTSLPDPSTSTTVPEGEATTSTTTSTSDMPSTTLPPDSTTTTTEPPTPSTTTSSSSTTSTTDPAATTSTTTTLSTTSTTSSTDGIPTTTTSSTTTVTEPATTSSTTTIARPTTSSSTTAPTTSTTSTSHAIVTTTIASTTSTTVPSCAGADCPETCPPGIAFTSLRCRLTSLATSVDGTSELAQMRAALDRHLRKAHALFDHAESRCGAGRAKPARRNLRMSRKRVVMIATAMHAKLVRRRISPDVSTPIVRASAALASDMRTLATHLLCP